jgi:hypothetical protein
VQRESAPAAPGGRWRGRARRSADVVSLLGDGRTCKKSGHRGPERSQEPTRIGCSWRSHVECRRRAVARGRSRRGVLVRGTGGYSPGDTRLRTLRGAVGSGRRHRALRGPLRQRGRNRRPFADELADRFGLRIESADGRRRGELRLARLAGAAADAAGAGPPILLASLECARAATAEGKASYIALKGRGNRPSVYGFAGTGAGRVFYFEYEDSGPEDAVGRKPQFEFKPCRYADPHQDCPQSAVPPRRARYLADAGCSDGSTRSAPPSRRRPGS